MKQHYQSVIYQIWPRSFKDSQNDGIGDLQGIISKLDYLASLGIDYLWLSPIYASPNADYGYDVSDYYQIHPDFGTMEDFDTLLFEANRRGIKLIMDIVANHTSIEHTWFQSAQKDVSSPYRDFYYFMEGKGNHPPNNWISIFGGSAWRRIEDNTYALTLFTPSQVDLNWQNPKVRNEVVRILKFWLDKGVAGFRWDVINTISKIDGLIDKNPNKKGLQFADDYIINREPSLQYIDEIMSQLSDYPDALMIGEGMLIDQASAAKYAPNQMRRMDMMFHFDLHMLGCGPLGKYDFRKLYRFSTMDMKKVIFSWQKDMQDKGYWIGNYLSNHDQPRQISRFGDDKTYRVASGKALAVLNFTLSGTPFVYQGEEIGMTNCHLDMDEWRDFEAKNGYLVLQSMMKLPAFLAKKIVMKMTRDHARTVMQWTDETYAGFSNVNPWIKVNPNKDEISVQACEKDSNSLLHFYRKMIELHKQIPAFTFGRFEPEYIKHPQLIAYRKEYNDESYLIVINFSKKMATCKLKGTWLDAQEVLYTHTTRSPWVKKMILLPYEARIMKINLF